jgi:hypothetical protein
MGESGQGGGPPKSGWARLLEIGPAWITAISGLIVALAAAGFFVGHVTASGGTAAPQPTATVTKPASDPGSDSSPNVQPSVASSRVTYLTQFAPLQAGAYGVTDGPVQIGANTYPHSTSFPCGQGAAEVQSVVYDVAGFRYLNATVGIPNNSPDASGSAANVILYKNGSSTTLGPPISGPVGKGQTVHVFLHGAAQLNITCSGAPGSIALGDAVLRSS